MPVVSLPAPYGGQNNKDGLYNLGPQFASSLVNWIPGPGYLDARGPVTAYSSNTAGAPIVSMWRHPSGNVVFATTGGDIYLAASTIGAALTTTPTNGDFHGNTFQDRLILCNGVDTPQIYDGTTVTAGVYSGSGLTASNLYGSVTFKGRVYYWEAAQRFFWYAAAGAFQGALSKFDLSTFTRGDGYLVSIAPLTFDGGSGPDDLIAFLFSSGEVLVYQGDDPGTTNSWQQVGAFRIGNILGRACWAVVGSSTLVATEIGVVDLARALAVGAADDSATIGQQFGAQNFAFTGGTPRERRLVFDQANRVLWLFVAGTTFPYVQRMSGMDSESRGWFTTSGLVGNVTAPCGTPTGLLLGANVGGGLFNGPSRSQTGFVANDAFTGGAITYTSQQVVSLFDGQRNAKVEALAVLMQQVSNDDPSASLTVASGSENDPNPVGISYQPSAFVRAFNPESAYGTRIIVVTTLSAKSGVRWFSTDLLAKPGRQV